MRLTRRLRSVSQRLEGIEDAVDRLDQRLEGLGRPGTEDRLAAMEAQIARLATELGALTAALDAGPDPVPREQERLEVEEPASGRRPRRSS